jgi:hypothetical protein
MPIVAIDFDGVLSDYTGWRGYSAPIDPPVDGALQAIRDYSDAGYEICIHTSRADSAKQISRLVAWFKEHGLERKYVEGLTITNQKPPAIIYIDDRAWYFAGRFPSIEELKNFKTWRGM